VDKELTGWSHRKSCAEWLDVEAETSDEWHSSGIGTEVGAV